MAGPGNSINETTTGITGFTGTAFVGTPVTQYNILTGASTSSTINNIAPSATSGVPVISQGSSAQPIFGTAVVAGGGTGAVTLTGLVIGNGTSAMTASAITQHDVLVGGSSNAVTSVAPSATSGIPLVSNGASSDPSFTTAVVAGGGTGVATLTGLALASGTSAFTGVTYTAVTSWTPNLQINGSSTGITYTTQVGYYQQIGNMVYISFIIILSSKGASVGAVSISNLPVSTGTNGNSFAMATAYWNQVTMVGYSTIGMYFNTSSTVGNFIQSGTGVADGNLANTNISNTFSIAGNGFYFTN